MISSRSIGILWVLAQAGVLSLWAVSVLTLPDPLRHSMRFLPLTGLGALLAVAGAIFALAGTRGLGSAFTVTPEPKGSAELVDTGIYARTRHPIYGGILLIIWGITLPLLSGIPSLAAAGITLFFHAKAGYEEKRLQRRFPEYKAYMKRTWRFLPKPGKINGA